MSSARGFDYSHWQRDIPGQAAADAFDFVGMKATQGSGYVDSEFRERRAVMRPYLGKGLSALLLYHFLDLSSPAAQAAHFLATVGSLVPGELLALDWEAEALSSPAVLRSVWLGVLGHSRHVLVYESASQAGRVHAACPGAELWVADWTPPYLPGWIFLQYTDRGQAFGQSLDFDLFAGDAAALAIYSGLHQPAPAPTEGALLMSEAFEKTYVRYGGSAGDLAGLAVFNRGYRKRIRKENGEAFTRPKATTEEARNEAAGWDAASIELYGGVK